MRITPRREKFRVGLSPLYLPYYDKLCLLLAPCWQPYYGIRDWKTQDELYAQGRTTEGKIVTDARGGESPHNYGCATDWTIFIDGKPIWPLPEDPRWEDYINAVTLAKLRPGIEFGDMPHNELRIGLSWLAVRDAYKRGNMDAAQDFIASRLNLAQD